MLERFRKAGGREPTGENYTNVSPEMAAMLLRRDGKHGIGEEDVHRAVQILQKYKQGKASLENRIIQDELWWELRHWQALRQNDKVKADGSPESTSAWLFNSILNKHADAMDNYPTPVFLPREKSDTESAKTLCSVVPVVLEYNEYEDTYSGNWWEKLKHGTGAYGIFWDSSKDGGLGDIEIRDLDILNLFWEPGITDIQDSKNLFIVDLEDRETVEQAYPQLEGKINGNAVDVASYIYDDNVDTTDKVVIVDWYYKVSTPSGRQAVHYVKFVGETVLYASENDPEYASRGLYDHGQYPVVFDTLFPEKGTPIGFGYVAICKDPQLYIDKLFSNILENSMQGTKRRWFASSDTNVNHEQLLDWNEPIVECEGEIDDRRLKEIVTQPLDAIYTQVLQMKIDEMKETSANRDFNSGSTASGVTAASAIAALQEAGNKVSRDMIGASYRAYSKIMAMCIELMRQFYDVSRSFRIDGKTPGEFDFIDFSNADIRDQYTEDDSQGNPMFRRPIFDIKIKAQKKNPFSRAEENERAKELYGLGFFNPDRAQEAAGALELMDFEGIDKVKEYVAQGQTLLNICKELQIKVSTYEMLLGVNNTPVGGEQQPGQPPAPAAGSGINSQQAAAQRPKESYSSALQKRS